MKLNTIYNEDCLDTMGRMPDDYVDLTVTSPPYDGLRSYHGYSFDFEPIAQELFRVTKPGGVLVWVVGDSTRNGSESLTSFKQAIYFVEQCGFKLHDTMIYNRSCQPLTHKRYEQWFEYMFVFSKGQPRTFNPIKVPVSEIYKRRRKTPHVVVKHRNSDGVRPNVSERPSYATRIKENVWTISSGYASTRDEIAYQHPAIFPEQLANDHIVSWSNEGDLVYDCFMGSGTVAKMAFLNRRKFLGSEISKEYCRIAAQRLQDAKRTRRRTVP